MKATKVGVYTDPTVAELLPMKTAVQSLESAGVPYEVFKDCKVEPSQDRSVSAHPHTYTKLFFGDFPDSRAKDFEKMMN